MPDPHYGLPVVVCPGCKLACVRTKHPDQEFWRSFRHHFRAFRMLFLVLMVTCVSSLAIWGMVFWGIDLFGTRRDRLALSRVLDPSNIDEQIGLVVILLIAMGAGASMRLVYGHRRATTAMLILMICSAFWITIDISSELLMQLMAWAVNYQRNWYFPSDNELIMRLQLYALLMIVAAIGLVPGAMLHRMVLIGNRKRFRKIRRKLRKRQHRLD